jgi:hypothetical protein
MPGAAYHICISLEPHCLLTKVHKSPLVEVVMRLPSQIQYNSLKEHLIVTTTFPFPVF